MHGVKAGTRPLWTRPAKATPDVVRMLVEAFADVDAYDKNHLTALMLAAMMGHTDVVKVLIDAGADVNMKGDGGYTALMDALGRGRSDIADLLKEAGARGIGSFARWIPTMSLVYSTYLT